MARGTGGHGPSEFAYRSSVRVGPERLPCVVGAGGHNSRAATILYHGQRDLRQIPFRCWSAEKHGSIIHRRVLILAPESTKPCVLDGVSARHHLLAA